MTFEDDDRRVEDELRRAFKAEDPGEAFTQRVLDRVAGDTRADATRVAGVAGAAGTPTLDVSASAVRPSGSPSAINWRVTLALAASLVMAVGGATWVRHARYVEEGERARAEVLMALRVTSEKLNVVRSAVKESAR